MRALYRGAIDAVALARVHLEKGAIRERSRQITKALLIVHELLRSLDHTLGAAVSRQLAELYVYIANRLIEANRKQIDEPLAEVERLLATLLEAWSSLPQYEPVSRQPAFETREPVSRTS